MTWWMWTLLFIVVYFLMACLWVKVIIEVGFREKMAGKDTDLAKDYDDKTLQGVNAAFWPIAIVVVLVVRSWCFFYHNILEGFFTPSGKKKEEKRKAALKAEFVSSDAKGKNLWPMNQ